MIYTLVCARVRDSAWGMERGGGGGGGGGGNWSQRAAFRMNGGGGRPPRAYAGSGAGYCLCMLVRVVSYPDPNVRSITCYVH